MGIIERQEKNGGAVDEEKMTAMVAELLGGQDWVSEFGVEKEANSELTVTLANGEMFRIRVRKLAGRRQV